MWSRKKFYLKVIGLSTLAAILYGDILNPASVYFVPSTLRDTGWINPFFYPLQKPEPVEVPLVLIIAYKRSGSSYTGNVFNSWQDAFYVYEPLWHIYERVLKHPNFMLHVDPSNGPAPVKENATVFAKDILVSYFTCRIKNIPVINFYDVFLREGLKTTEFFRCGKWRPECAHSISEVCHNSKLRAIKTIRMRMSDAVDLFRYLPSLKIVHLMRDPRGVISSRLKGAGNYRKINDALADAEVLCEEMLADLKSAETVRKLYPEKLYTLLYEDLAETPDKTSEAVYSFLNLTTPASVKAWLRKNTRASDDSTDFLGTQRKNSSLTSSAWRRHLSLINAKYIDTVCREVYEKVGYLPVFNASIIQDTRIPLRKNTLQSNTNR